MVKQTHSTATAAAATAAKAKQNQTDPPTNPPHTLANEEEADISQVRQTASQVRRDKQPIIHQTPEGHLEDVLPGQSGDSTSSGKPSQGGLRRRNAALQPKLGDALKAYLDIHEQDFLKFVDQHRQQSRDGEDGTGPSS